MENALQSFTPQHEYLVCIDSDGCLLDNMELKHKECFCPATVNCWNLQKVSRYAREAAEFVNLYSVYRGTNRFPAIVKTLELTADRKEVKERGYELPDLTPLKEWIKNTKVLSAGAILEYVNENEDAPEILVNAAEWSKEVDENIKHIVRNISPFPNVFKALEKLSTFADIIIVSATPHEALERELTACGIAPYTAVIAGQEFGTKAECIRMAMEGKYQPDHVLKIGDAPGDHAAASANHVLFNPIIPSQEEKSWEKIAEEGALKFKALQFAGEYMQNEIKAFMSVLRELPPWENEDETGN